MCCLNEGNVSFFLSESTFMHALLLGSSVRCGQSYFHKLCNICILVQLNMISDTHT